MEGSYRDCTSDSDLNQVPSMGDVRIYKECSCYSLGSRP